MPDYLKKNYLINFCIIIIIFSLDRISKIYIINLDKNNYDPLIYKSSFLNIFLTWNDGIAFGLLSFTSDLYYNIISILIILVIIILFIMILKNEGFKRYSLLMVFGGALGNLYDRIFYNSVPDFIDFHIGDYHWFIFNVADIFITIGVLCLISTEIFLKNNESDL
tara:strand:- start:392 stop:886 length:495 start_codon:yes stop_codon:yes gene_type:complete